MQQQFEQLSSPFVVQIMLTVSMAVCALDTRGTYARGSGVMCLDFGMLRNRNRENSDTCRERLNVDRREQQGRGLCC